MLSATDCSRVGMRLRGASRKRAATQTTAMIAHRPELVSEKGPRSMMLVDLELMDRVDDLLAMFGAAAPAAASVVLVATFNPRHRL